MKNKCCRRCEYRGTNFQWFAIAATIVVGDLGMFLRLLYYIIMFLKAERTANGQFDNNDNNEDDNERMTLKPSKRNGSTL